MNGARLPVFTVMGVAFALLASTPEGASLFEWQRGLAAGEPWRLLTGHFSHWSPAHLHWDLLVFAIFGALLESRSRRAFLGVMALSGVGLGVALPLLHPAMEAYRGLSGIDCALAAAVGAMHLGRRTWGDAAIGGAILLFVGGKVAFELGAGGPLFVDSGAAGFVSLPAAHGLGALAGLLGITMHAVMRQNSGGVRAT
ncbi:MAG: rhombosortase [Myxococcota bacterium]